MLINQAIHTVDLIEYIAGACKCLTAHTATDHLKDILEVEDAAYILMELESGVIALLFATTAFSDNSPVFIEFNLDEAVLRIEGEMLYKIDKDGKTEILCEKNPETFSGKSYWGHGHKAIIRDFYDCLRTGRKFSIDAHEGGKALKTVAAAYKSAKENKVTEAE